MATDTGQTTGRQAAFGRLRNITRHVRKRIVGGIQAIAAVAGEGDGGSDITSGSSFYNFGAFSMSDDGTPRNNGGDAVDPATASFTEVALVQYGATATRLYEFSPFPTPGRITRLNVSNTGVAVDSSTQIPTNITTDSIRFAAGRLYTATGKVIDPEAGTIVGSFATGVNNPVPFAIDTTTNLAFYATLQSGTLTITAFDINSFQSTGSLNILGISGK